MKGTEINKVELRRNTVNQNNYAQDILGNTEVDVDINNTQRNSLAMRVQQLNSNFIEPQNDSVNSPHLVHNDTEVPQNLITSVANNELRMSRILNNNESHEVSMVENEQDNLQFHNYFENLPTERENDLMNNASLMNNSQLMLINNNLDKGPQTTIVS